MEKVEKKLLEYYNALESTTDLIAVIDKNHIYSLVNNAFLEQRGLSRNQVVGKHVKDVIGSQAYEEVLSYIKQAFNGKIITYEMDLTYENIGKRNLFIKYIPIFYSDSEINSVIAIISDITMIKNAEKVKTRLYFQLLP